MKQEYIASMSPTETSSVSSCPGNTHDADYILYLEAPQACRTMLDGARTLFTLRKMSVGGRSLKATREAAC